MSPIEQVKGIVSGELAPLRAHVAQLERLIALGPDAVTMARRFYIDDKPYRVADPTVKFCDVQLVIDASATAETPAQVEFRAPCHLVTRRITVSTSDSSRLRAARLSWRRDNGEQLDFRSGTASGTIIRPPLEALFTSALSDRPLSDREQVFRKDRTMIFEGEPLDGTPPITLDLILAFQELIEA